MITRQILDIMNTGAKECERRYIILRSTMTVTLVTQASLTEPFTCYLITPRDRDLTTLHFPLKISSDGLKFLS